MLAYSNLAGQGPDISSPHAIRYVNVARVITPSGSSEYLDLSLVANGNYTAFSPANNGMHGQFARVNFMADTCSDLRVYVRRSCATADSCALCDDDSLYPTDSAKDACYAAGCSCFAQTVYTRASCAGSVREARRTSYACPLMDTTTPFPPGSLVSFAVYDLDQGPNGDYTEQVIIAGYEYFKTPLRPASGNDVFSQIAVDRIAGTFTSTMPGTAADEPSDLDLLTDEQAARGVAFFFASSDGFIDARFCIAYSGTGTPEGANILFGGSSSLCAPPPPMPPTPPPRSPPPRHPPLPPVCSSRVTMDLSPSCAMAMRQSRTSAASDQMSNRLPSCALPTSAHTMASPSMW